MKQLVLTVLFGAMTNSLVVADVQIQLNQPFPSITLPSVEDQTAMSLGDFRGQKLMLHVFASW